MGYTEELKSTWIEGSWIRLQWEYSDGTFPKPWRSAIPNSKYPWAQRVVLRYPLPVRCLLWCHDTQTSLIQAVNERMTKLDYWHPRWKPKHRGPAELAVCRHSLYVPEHHVGKPIGRDGIDISASIPIVRSTSFQMKPDKRVRPLPIFMAASWPTQRTDGMFTSGRCSTRLEICQGSVPWSIKWTHSTVDDETGQTPELRMRGARGWQEPRGLVLVLVRERTEGVLWTDGWSHSQLCPQCLAMTERCARHGLAAR